MALKLLKKFFGDKYDEFVFDNFYNYLFLVDYKYRKPILGKGGKTVNGDLNKLYSELIKSEDDLGTIYNNFTNSYLRFVICRKFNESYKKFLKGFINILYTGKNSIIKKNVISQKIGAAIRGVIIPFPYIHEDYCAVSTIFADTLFPQLKGLWNNAQELNEIISWGHFNIPDFFFDFKNSLGKKKLYPWDEGFSYEEFCEYRNMTIDDVKNYIKRYSDKNKPYYFLLNRPPSICHLSFYSLKPIFFDDIGRGYCGDNFNSKNIINEKSENNPMSACIGISPLICSGMNADFDSDVLFLMSIFGDIDLSCMLPSKNFKTISNGEVRNGIEEMHEQMLKYFYKYDEEKAKIIHDKIEELMGGN